MTMSRGVIDDVPLSTIFPQASAVDLEAVQQAARAVDAARTWDERPEWEWALAHAVFPGASPGTPVVFGVDVVAYSGGGDQPEFLLQMLWTEDGRLVVSAAVSVACWCETDHATHDVDAIELAVGTGTSIGQAFEVGAERLVGWLADPRDADYWRDRAALPPRWER
ncbi:hypothetical protein [Streptomyces sp. NBC_01264]|uniref:hypothetical protein n=1 Tax=Streptomyces sp. NBC_01264 TaxID=2903804 RepID=UPI00225A954E|nr:hypothetical protein [Streptomyces sp. NBC_01264]MCX4775288.1 hypothetical protein [Streptomyces sp. NBC_01264]